MARIQIEKIKGGIFNFYKIQNVFQIQNNDQKIWLKRDQVINVKQNKKYIILDWFQFVRIESSKCEKCILLVFLRLCNLYHTAKTKR